jgi:hypothetical protein
LIKSNPTKKLLHSVIEIGERKQHPPQLIRVSTDPKFHFDDDGGFGCDAGHD